MAVCVVTGAGSGIGRAVAVELSLRNDYDTIALVGRRVHMLEETQRLMKGKRVFLFGFDLSNADKIPSLVGNIYKKCGSIQCLLNIAGYTDPQALITTSIESMTETYTVNVFAPFMMMRECVKYMRSNTGTSKILNVASTAGISDRPGWLSYASSKAALVSMSNTLAEELAEYGIKVYCVSPGRCATELRRKLAPTEDPSTIMQPDEVSKIICNLVAADENCLDGQNIIIRRKGGG
ncbi:MAG: SDR family oxidoreductase [Oscillospiraceae bacterium]|nr:SDR family oxidoreductase [Oscillospiraceae bacterium]